MPKILDYRFWKALIPWKLKALLSALWHGARSRISALFPGSKVARNYRQYTFQNVYDSKLWGSTTDGRYFSGVGSIGKPAATYVEAMAPILTEAAHKLGSAITIVDLGCGDFRIGSALLAKLPKIRYIGCDIVPGLIAQNNQRFASAHVTFRCLDITADDLPPGQIFLMRQVLQHLPNRDIARILAKLRNCPYVFVTEGQPLFPEGPVNPDKSIGAEIRFNWKTGRGRGVELDQPPYNCAIEEVCRVQVDPEVSREMVITYRILPKDQKPMAGEVSLDSNERAQIKHL